MPSNEVRVIGGPYAISATSIQQTADLGVMIAAGAAVPAVSFVSLQSTELRLQLGLPDLGPTLAFTEEGISITYGPPEVGASITMNAEGITLQAGPTTSLKLTPAGIVLQAAQIQLQAMASYELTTASLSETAADVTRSAAMTQIS